MSRSYSYSSESSVGTGSSTYAGSYGAPDYSSSYEYATMNRACESSDSSTHSHGKPFDGASHYYAPGDAKKSKEKHVNVHTTCGRHSNEWLFSGWSFRRKD